VAHDDQPTSEGSTVTFGELRAWLTEHGLVMDECAEVSIGHSRGKGVMLRTVSYAKNEDGRTFLDPVTKAIALDVRYVPLKRLPGVGGPRVAVPASPGVADA
jgi:hypothetical protein